MANDGNDQLWGRQASDVLIGGEGYDFLNGRAGADTYYVTPDTAGIDVIHDSGTPFSYDGWQEPYANWFYQNQGYPNWRELRYSGTLPDLPRFPVNDFEALDPWVRAGIFGRDTVEFAPGLALGDLQFAWGYAEVVAPDGSATTMNSLDITWGVDRGIQIVIPTDGAGIGIELFKFADGSLYTMADILHNAPPAPPGYLASDDDIGNDNTEPFLVNPIATQTTMESQPFVFSIPADAFMDPDADDALTYSVTLDNGDPLPSWLSFDATTGTLSGTPDDPEVGTLTIRVDAIDQHELSASTTFDLTVNNVNDAPIAAQSLEGQTATQDQAFSFVVPAASFSDADAGDTLSLEAALANGDPLPTWLTFDAATGTFSGIPANADVGNLAVTVTATDIAGAAVSSTFAIAVTNINDAPTVAQAIPSQTTNEDALFSFVVSANTFSDIDTDDHLSLDAIQANGSALPSWLIFDAATQTFQGTPGNDNVGTIQIALTATDSADASATTLFVLNVANVNDAPVVGVALADQTVVEYKPLTFTVPANTFADVDKFDSSAITASLDNGAALPDWLTFDADTLTFSGTPSTLDLGTLQVRVIATDTGGLSTSDIFALTVNAAPGQKLTGGSGNDTLTGASGNDTLNGGLGADTLSGGTGNDTYIVDNAGDVVIENVNAGTDTVQSSITYTLGANVENLKLIGTAAINGAGNELNNTLTGNGAANTLNGGTGNDNINGGVGADTLIGGLGNDTLTVDNVGDVVVENANEGTDRVNAYITYTLGDNVENLTLLGTAVIDGNGNALANALTGNGADNRLAGGDGNDTLWGGAGNDTLLGQAGDDTLNGGTGADALFGGAGNDIYVITDSQDTVTELANEGVDRVNSSISYTLGDNIENLTLAGTAETYGIGNSLDNTLTGNNAANYLAGMGGNVPPAVTVPTTSSKVAMATTASPTMAGRICWMAGLGPIP